VKVIRVAIAAMLVSLSGCGGGGGSSGNATLNLGLTDAPVDSASHVVLEFTGVELKPSNGDNTISWTFSPAKQIDLLQFQNGNAAVLLSGASVPAGNYDWIRLKLNVDAQNLVADSYIEIEGARYPIRVPSGAQTGLKLVQGFTMTANQIANFTIDFNLQQAVTAPSGQQVGQNQVYFVRPALRLIDNVQAGTISGTVALATLQSLEAQGAHCFDSTGAPTAHVYIFSGSGATLTDIQFDPMTDAPPTGHINPVVTPPVTFSSGQYSYSQPFLLAGSYTLGLTCDQDDPNAADALSFAPSSVGVVAAVTTSQTTTVSF
jgi:hypothetical protein